MKDKIVKVITKVFGYGIMIALFAGGLSFFGYLAAMIIGGDKAEAICTFIYKQYFPVVFIITATLILLGLVKMYICGEQAFTAGKKKKTDKAVKEE